MISITKVKQLYDAGKNSHEITMNIWCELKANQVDVTVNEVKLKVEDALLMMHKRKKGW